MKGSPKLNLNIIHIAFILFLAFTFLIQYKFITPPTNDYFNVNLNLVTAIILCFALVMTLISLYNFKTLKKKIYDQTKNVENIGVSYLQTLSPITGGALMCQLIYFHIYGQKMLILFSAILWIILLFLKVKIKT